MRKIFILYILVLLVGFILCLSPAINNNLYAQEHYPYITNEIIKIKNIPTLKDTVLIKALVLQGNKKHISSPDSALVIYRKALAYSIPIHYYNGIISSLMDIGACYFLKAEYQNAKNVIFQSLYYARFSDRALPTIYNALGAVYTEQGMSDSAVYFYYCALNEFTRKKITDSSLFVNIYANLGGALLDIRQEGQAFYYLNKAKQLALKDVLKNKEYLPGIYSNMGSAYVHKENFDSGNAYLHYALRLNLQDKYYSDAQGNYIDIGRLLLEQKKIREALLYFDSASQINKVDTKKVSSLQQGFGAAYLQLGDYAKALFYYKRALAISEKSGAFREKINIYTKLAEIYQKTGQDKLAYKYLMDYTDLKDQLLNEEKVKAIDQLEIKYRTAQKDKEIATKQAQLIRRDAMLKQKNWLIASVIGIVLFVIIISAILLRGNKRKQLLRLHTKDQEQKIDQLKASISGEEKERSRIARELHDGIMVQLSVVKMNLKMLPQPYKELENTDYYKQLVQQMEAATAELRQTAHNLMPDMLLQEGLAQAILYFCSMLRKNTGLQIFFQPEGPDLPRLQPEFELAVYRIVQELVQNILKHAQATKAIVQLLNYQNELLTITVEDNGIGFNTTMNKNEGQGLTNIKTRIAALGGFFDLQSDSDSGTTIHLEFELHNVQHPNNFTHGNNTNNS